MTIEQIGIGAAPGDNTGDGLRTAMTKVNNNFSNSSHAASKLVGTAPEEIPINSDLGTASTKNTGTATGEVPTADELSMVGQTINYTGENYQPNATYGIGAPQLMYTTVTVASGAVVSGTLLRGVFFVAGGGSPNNGIISSGAWKNTSGRIANQDDSCLFVRES